MFPMIRAKLRSFYNCACQKLQDAVPQLMALVDLYSGTQARVLNRFGDSRQYQLFFEQESKGWNFCLAAGLTSDVWRLPIGGAQKRGVWTGFERVLGPFQVRFRFVPGSSFGEKGRFHWKI